jgi:flavin-dependent dehydrogenase
VTVAVIGGGPAGLATAIELRAAGVPVTVVAGRRADRKRLVETLPADARPLLRRLGVWEEFQRAGHPPSLGVSSAWASAELVRSDAFTAPLGGGWLIDRDRFDAALLDAARSAGAEVIDRARVSAVRPGWSLTVPTGPFTGRDLTATFVVDATGRTGLLARRYGAPRAADRLMCAYAVLPAAPVSRRPVLESAPDGWWYAAGFDETRAVAGFFTDSDLMRQASATRPPAWHDLLARTRHVFGLLGRPGTPASVRTVPAASHCLTRLYGEGWAAVGDAATALDPLSSAGVIAALRSGVDTAAGVRAALGGDYGALAAHQRRAHVRYTTYLLDRCGYYGMEPRWPDAPFWRRRVIAGRPSSRRSGVLDDVRGHEAHRQC